MDLENGGAAVVESWPYPADKRLKEQQPFTWLGTAPYIAVILAGAALIAVGSVIDDSGGPTPATEGQGRGQDSQQAYLMTTGHQVRPNWLVCGGVVLMVLGLFASAYAADEGCCACNLPRFGSD